MKRISFLLCMLLMISFVGCSQQTGNSPFGFIPSSSGDDRQTQTPNMSPTAKGDVKTVTDKQLTLSLAFGDKSGTYTGQLVNGLPQGNGSFNTENTDGLKWTYDGNWENGHMQGTGATTWENGWSQSGTYAGDYLETGQEYYKGKLAYSGEFSKEMYDGQGIIYDEAGHVIFKGEFINGYFNENEEERVTRADMIAPEDTPITKKNFKSIYNDINAYFGRWIEVRGKVAQFWDEKKEASTKFQMTVDGDAGYPVAVWYRYGADEARIELKDNVTVFGIIVGSDSYTSGGTTYYRLLVNAHVVYID